MRKIIAWYKQERKILGASILCGAFIATLVGLYTMHYSNQTLEAISSQVVRFHILPNSDSDEDIALKMLVKEAVLEEYRDALAEANSIYEAREFLSTNLDEIEHFAQSVVRAQGINHPVHVSLGESRFPTREYAQFALPSGTYEALQINIGDSSGSNWWCVMFPPLCFVDVTRGEISAEDKALLRELLSESEFALLYNETRENDPVVQVRFRIIEWWQDNQSSDNGTMIAMGNSWGS